MPPPSPPSRDERVYTALFLLSLALRPVPDGFPTSALRVDRADLWRIAEDAGAPLGRNRFHAATAALAEDEDQDGWSDLLIVSREPGNRRVVVTLRPDGDPDGWEEALDSFGLALDSATEAAQKLGLDTASPLPADVLLPFAAEPEDDEDDEDDDAVPTKVCTRCREEKPATDDKDEDGFPLRVTGSLSSWCRACTASASKAAAVRRNPHRRVLTPQAREAAEEQRAKNAHTKWCNACRKRLNRTAFYRDRQKHDGLMTVCKSCHSRRRADQRIRVSVDF